MATKKKMLQAAAGVSTEPEGAWDLSFAYYDPPEGLAWNLSTAVYAGVSKSISAEEAGPQGVFFKADGTKMYVTGVVGDDVNEYGLSTAWNVATASYVQNFSVATNSANPYDLYFKPDGTKMYIMSQTGDNVGEYDLSTAWDISTASFVQNFSVNAQEALPTAIFFKPDGTKMYVSGTNSDNVNEYDLSTPWDISTASYLHNLNVGPQDTSPQSISFKPDGAVMYMLGATGNDVNEYSLSTPWDVSSASYVQVFSVSAQDTGPQGIFFKPDGTAFYIVGTVNDTVYQYVLGGFSVAAQDTVPEDVFFKPDGTKMYILGSTGDDVNEYDLSTAWDISTASFLQLRSVSGQETVPAGLFFKPDGTKMYVIGNAAGGGDVNEYDLSTAWDISTSTYIQNFNASQDTTANSVFFKPDGTKMYVTGQASDSVHEYDLSTAWNLSTASFLQSFSVATEETAPQGLFFKPDGKKMYVVGISGDDVNEYDLSTAWDVSSANYSQNFSVAGQESIPNGLFFKFDGTQMFIVGQNSDSVFSYTLGPQD
jgi:DNA-binding beta-propeller fold protein YncE